MKKFFFLLYFLSTFTLAGENSIHQFKTQDTKGEPMDLSQFKSGPLLIVNIATRCGYTDQLDELEKLYQKYKGQGFQILGVPSNDFGSQTPESDAKVAEFCRLKYGVSFKLAKKTPVKGGNKPDFIRFMLVKSSGDDISWNFEKFLFDKNGHFFKRYKSSTKPDDSNLIKDIESLIK